MKKYTEQKLYYRGKLSKTYRVSGKATEEPYIMKVLELPEEKVEKSEKLLSLEHSNITKYVESFAIKNERAFIIEYCCGGSLRALIKDYQKKKQSIPEKVILKYAEQMLSGLEHLHCNKVMHGNLKPENVYLDDEGNLKLTDYGLLHGPVSKRDRKEYLSLDVLQGKEYDFADDIWSLGCIIYELCSFEPPYSYKSSVQELIQALNKRAYDTTAIKKFSKKIKELISTMLNQKKRLRSTSRLLLIDVRLKTLQGNVAIKHFDHGDRYEGELKDNKRDGIGVYYYGNFAKYNGQWKEDKREGEGTLFYSNGNIYDGEFKNDQINGKGVLYYANGTKYEGEFKDGLYHGQGTFYGVDGILRRERNEHKLGYISGGSDHFCDYGFKYTGEWRNNKKHGTGTEYYANGNRYEGQWKNDKKSGKGAYYWTKNVNYKGDWKNDSVHGQGVFTSEMYGKYEGEWAYNKRHGKGVSYHNKKKHYEGEYKNDFAHGKGIFYYASGNACEGVWKYDKKIDEEVLIYANDNRLVGEWEKNHSKRVLHHFDGTQSEES
eukprot:TRINITY_DN3647_c0_g3_i4.p1 TRINITY_DN3647_c0_g3~~TRINITY_DN3647_c0_g3_i4.p1  ORF type:complete len:546 (-),score=64.91 TRINITY_DN3647_c0_g3_i4:152-1789(-)